MRRFKLSYANVLSTLALFVALGGVSYAAGVLPFNSVGKNHVRDDAVGNAELRHGSVGTREIRVNGVRSLNVRDHSLLCDDFNPSEPVCQPSSGTGGATGASGVPGPAGPTGATGAVGATGESGADLMVTARRQAVELVNPSCSTYTTFNGLQMRNCQYPTQEVRGSCLAGERATGGSAANLSEGSGGGMMGPPPNGTFFASYVGYDHPDPSEGEPTGWATTASGSSYVTGSSEGGPPAGEPPAPQARIDVVCVS